MNSRLWGEKNKTGHGLDLGILPVSFADDYYPGLVWSINEFCRMNLCKDTNERLN